MNLLHIKRRIHNLKQDYKLEILFFCLLISLLFLVKPIFKFLLRIPDQPGRYKVLTFNNNKGQTFYVTGIYIGGWERNTDNYSAKDTFKVEGKAVKFVEQQNKLLEANIKKREDAEFRLVDIEP